MEMREISGAQLSAKIKYMSREILRYEIIYPVIRAQTQVEGRINKYHLNQARDQERLVKNRYLPAAREQCKAMRGHEGFEPFEISASYQVMHNSRLLVSLFTDTYLQLRHRGSRVTRTSATYDMRQGTVITLSQLMGRGGMWRQIINTALAEQIQREAELNPGCYFSDWRQLYQSKYRDGSYYLTDEGIVIYFQQDAIANQNAGLPSFLIPFSAFPDGIRYRL